MRLRISKVNISGLLLLLIIPGSIVVDLLNGFIQIVVGSDFSIGVVYRGIILIVLFLFAFRRWSQLNLFFVLVLGLFMIAQYKWALDSSFFSVSTEMQSFSRIIYLYVVRSEEHTSELQSRPHLVCRLLLEKK